MSACIRIVWGGVFQAFGGREVLSVRQRLHDPLFLLWEGLFQAFGR